VIYKEGSTVAIHYKKDRVISDTNCWGETMFSYGRHSDFKRCKIIKVKRHWNYFFKTMYLLDDGFWYPLENLTPIMKSYGALS